MTTMNIEDIILTKIIANQIQQYLKMIPYYDKMGFIMGMKGWTNTRKSSIIYHINETKKITI